VSRGSPQVQRSSFGRPCNFVIPLLESADGFAQHHLEHWGASVFTCSFGHDRYLVVQSPLNLEEPTLVPPPAFTSLAIALQRELETPRENGEPPTSDIFSRDARRRRDPKSPVPKQPRTTIEQHLTSRCSCARRESRVSCRRSSHFCPEAILVNLTERYNSARRASQK
jgi:hypothetical protein